MPPEHLRFGGGAAGSTISPAVAVMLLIATTLIMVLPLRKVILPFLVAFFCIPIGSVLVVGGAHFTALRILILAVLARRLTLPQRGKYPGGFTRIDGYVVLWAISAFIAFWLEFPGVPSLIQGLGVLVDTLGGYLAIRSLIPDTDGIRYALKSLAVVSAILGLGMLYEQFGHINVFGLLGGMLNGTDITVRDGHIRSGATLGCLYAGAFSGALIPLFVWLWKEPKCRLMAGIGFAGSLTMTFTSFSSTSQLSLLGAVAGLAFWPMRKQMRLFRWSVAAGLFGLNLVMKAPVWALIARVDLTGSSSSYQRYELVDMTIRHFRDWFLIGTPDYVNWGWDSWDLCNQFAAVALTGGLLTLIFYIGIFKTGFAAVGNARKRVEGNRRQEWFAWCFGASLFSTVVGHFGINYMAELLMGFFPLVACIAVVSYETKRADSSATATPNTLRWRWAALAASANPILSEPQPVNRRDSLQKAPRPINFWSKA